MLPFAPIRGLELLLTGLTGSKTSEWSALNVIDSPKIHPIGFQVVFWLFSFALFCFICPSLSHLFPVDLLSDGCMTLPQQIWKKFHLACQIGDLSGQCREFFLCFYTINLTSTTFSVLLVSNQRTLKSQQKILKHILIKQTD